MENGNIVLLACSLLIMAILAGCTQNNPSAEQNVSSPQNKNISNISILDVLNISSHSPLIMHPVSVKPVTPTNITPTTPAKPVAHPANITPRIFPHPINYPNVTIPQPGASGKVNISVIVKPHIPPNGSINRTG